uniref:Cytidylate kinase n=1 Tax=Staphylothermus marinus TaxID=2280 RepID=A0A7C4NNY8_STAMA
MVVIAISGPPGSGKTTQAKLISQYFNLKYFSAGMLFREVARVRGVSLEELSRIALEDPSIDIEIDRLSIRECLKGDIVLDGHITAWIVGDLADVRIYLTASLLTRAYRISKRDGIPLDRAVREILVRENIQRTRFIKFYGIDPLDLSIFNLVINSDNMGIEETFETIRVFLEKSLKR